MPMVQHFRAMARNTAWSNWRLLSACCLLSDDDFAAFRPGPFPSLAAALNQLWLVDRYYLDAVEAGGRGHRLLDARMPYPRAADLLVAQQAQDRRLVAFCDRLTTAALKAVVPLDRGAGGVSDEPVERILSHLFVGQIHRRGQAHAMLAGTAVMPPQLDAFFLSDDPPTVGAELDMLHLR